MFRTLTPIFSIVVGIAIFFLFTRPMFEEIRVIQDETNEFRVAVEKATEFNARLQQLLTQKNALSALELERLEALLPQEVNEVTLLVDLEAMSERHGMLLGNISVSSPVEAVEIADNRDAQVSFESFESVDINFELIGTYEQLRSMLTDIERSLVMMEILSIEFSANPFDLQQYAVSIRAYALPTSTEI